MCAFRIKQQLQAAVGSFHRAVMRRPLPDKLALCLHTTRPWAATLDERLKRFLDLGYRFVGPDAFVAGSGRLIMLSFDDNYRSWVDCLPMFERLGVTVTFYVNTLPFRGRASDAELSCFFRRISAPPEPTLTTEEVKCLAEAGHTIGAHTHTHPNLMSLALDEAKHEITTSKRILEDILGKPVTSFAYPFGARRYFCAALKDFCFANGFRTISTGIPAMQHARPESGIINRSVLQLSLPFERMLDNLSVDGRLFERITGLNAVAD